MITVNFVPLYIIGGILLLVFLLSIPGYLKTLRLRHAFRLLPQEVHREVLKLIDDFGSQNCMNAILVDTRWRQRREDIHVISSFIAGVPYLEEPEVRFITDSRYRFVAQIRIPQAPPESLWQGHLFVLFDDLKSAENVTLHYPAPRIERCATLEHFRRSPDIELLQLVRLPKIAYRDTYRRSNWSPHLLLAHVPRLREHILGYFNQPAELLGELLRPGGGRATFEADVVIQVGGKPVYIQPPRKMTCRVCGKPMRFIFHFGYETTSKVTPRGDCATLYVFGCRDHPDQIGEFTQNA